MLQPSCCGAVTDRQESVLSMFSVFTDCFMMFSSLLWGLNIICFSYKPQNEKNHVGFELWGIPVGPVGESGWRVGLQLMIHFSVNPVITFSVNEWISWLLNAQRIVTKQVLWFCLTGSNQRDSDLQQRICDSGEKDVGGFALTNDQYD